MLNYIYADYKRIITRIPRVVFMVIFNAIFVAVILNGWRKAAGNYTSVAFLDSASTFFGFFFLGLIALIDFVQTYSFDFRAKTIQVALGIGISRFQVILSKLVQLALVLFTDLLVNLTVLGILSGIMGVFLNFDQMGYLFFNGLGNIALVTCCAGLLMPLIFRTQNMVLGLIGYIILVPGIPSVLVHHLTPLGPEFLQKLQLSRFFYDKAINLTVTNAIQDAFQLWPVLVAIVWFALGIYLSWLAFRKMELDF